MLLEAAERDVTPARPQQRSPILKRAGVMSALLLAACLALVAHRHVGSTAKAVGVASSEESLREHSVEANEFKVHNKNALDVATAINHFASQNQATYTLHKDKNAFEPFGARDIDHQAVKVASAEECKQRCTQDDDCDCITVLSTENKCWKRKDCTLDLMNSQWNEGYDTYMRDGRENKALTGDSKKVDELFDTYKDKNAYYPYGATDIDDAEGVGVSSELECKERCAADDRCDCVTYGFYRCWTRCKCDVANMTSPYNGGYNVFKKKDGAKAACPKMCFPNKTLIARNQKALEMLKTTPTMSINAELMWGDEFEGSSLKTDKWSVRQDGTTVNHELQAYKKGDNVQVMDGHLRLQAKCEEFQGQKYTSGKLHSRMLFRAGHRVEAKLRMSRGQGTWPAFWLMGTGKDPWPKVGEIDILEYTGCENDRIMGNLHYEHRHGDWPMKAYRTRNFDVSTWHTYRVDWRDIGLLFFVDDEVVGLIPAQDCINDWPYNQNEFFIILNLALGGSLGGTCLTDGKQPGCDEYMDVDYVRVYKIE